MQPCEILKKLPDVLLPWYHDNKRELPWRQDRDPYHIWLSEIMLQQTRVEAVKSYYTRFIERIPDIQSLAKAEDELLYKLWEGLGYYSRVRNLKKAAQEIVCEHNGVFPSEYVDVLFLPGIGDYTAGAICSIAFNQKTPAVDGNVLRLVSRLTNDSTPVDLMATRKRVRDDLNKIYPENAGDFTQALMELGATVCGPNGTPDCQNCPCSAFCQANENGTAESLPVKAPKKQRRIEKMSVLILRCGDRYALQKRPSKGLLAGLWQFPNISGKHELDSIISEVEQLGIKPKEIIRIVEKKHIFTHIEWEMCGVYMEVSKMTGGMNWLTADEINKQIALPTAFRQFWEEIEYV